MTARDELKVGDLVFNGPADSLDRKVVHRILSINEGESGPTATLTSGQTGRLSFVPVSKLTPFRVTEAAA